jgi:hypothetical protein
VVSFKLALNNPTLPEITDGYETKLHHAPGHDRSLPILNVPALAALYSVIPYPLAVEARVHERRGIGALLKTGTAIIGM